MPTLASAEGRLYVGGDDIMHVLHYITFAIGYGVMLSDAVVCC
jgi:hypothetical protein